MNRLYLWTLLLFLAIILVALSFSAIDYSWESWKPATCMPTGCFCESVREGVVRQPANTWSNHAVVLVGLLILATARLDRSRSVRSEALNPMTSRSAYPVVFGLATLLIGFGSMFYHASLTFVGQWFDVMGMYLVATFLLLYSGARLLSFRDHTFVLCYLAINVLLGYVLLTWPVLRHYIFGLLILAALVSEAIVLRKLRPKVKTHYLYAAAGSLAAAYVVWLVDLGGYLCFPDSWLQGHAIWHVLAALANWFTYIYMRSEEKPQSRP